MNELQAPEATMACQAERIPAALKAGNAIAKATIQITRAGTGKVEEYELTFTPESEQQDTEA